jgi:hypothetical protein
MENYKLENVQLKATTFCPFRELSLKGKKAQYS